MPKTPTRPMSGKFDADLAAKILLDASIMGDEAAAEKWECSRRTIQRYRSRLGTDPEVSRSVQNYKEAQDKSWADQIPACLEVAIAALTESCKAANKSDPEAIAAIVQAFKAVAEVQITRDMINARYVVPVGSVGTQN